MENVTINITGDVIINLFPDLLSELFEEDLDEKSPAQANSVNDLPEAISHKEVDALIEETCRLLSDFMSNSAERSKDKHDE